MSVLNNLLYYTGGSRAGNLISPSSVNANSALSLQYRKFALIIHHAHPDVLTNTDTVTNTFFKKTTTKKTVTLLYLG